jgi:predicted nucleic acid-binding protein
VSLRTLQDSLPDGDRILLDTSTIASHFKGNEPASPIATHVIDHWIASNRNPAIISTVTAMELLIPPLHDRDDVLYRGMLFFLLHTRNLQIADITFRVAHEAAAVRAQYRLKTPDSLIVATARVQSVRHIVSNDSEWRRKLWDASSFGMTVCYLEDHLPFP